MATLGKLIKARYESHLADRQFRRDERFKQSTTFTRLGRDCLTFDRVSKGGALRMFLGIGIPHPEIEAKSPWWDVDEGDWSDAPPELDPNDFTLEHALSCAWQFLETCGFAWFGNPLALTPTEWRVKHKLLVRDHRKVEVTLSWPPTMSLPERIMRSKRCIPSFRPLPALQLRGHFSDVDHLHLGLMPFADALELKTAVEEQGLILDHKKT